MPSKNFKLLLGLITLLSTTTFAQEGSGYSIYDSTVISAKSMPQQNEFWNNTYSYPAKPRNMWEVGAKLGALTISGDVKSRFPTMGFGLHARKAFGYLFSLRVEYVNGTAKGTNWQNSLNYAKNPAWVSSTLGGNLPAAAGYNALVRNNNGVLTSQTGATPQRIYYNYKTNVQDLSIQGIVNLNNVRFHKQKTSFTLYGGAGIGFTAFNTMVNALGANGQPYTQLFSTVSAGQLANGVNYADRRDILKQLKSGMDNTYETEGQTDAGIRNPKLGKNILKPSGTILAGIAYKLSKRVNIALEDRHTFVKSDLMDGQTWQEQAGGDAVLTRDFDSWNFLSLSVNFNLGAKSVEPLWWLNPLDYAYSELNNPKHMKLPKPVFEDTDGDGVTDQLDKEPATVAGAPVDSHGVAKDTDGDGVPDYKDKQLITPTECQPVDADGVGKCPEPACCKENRAMLEELKTKGYIGECPTDYPSISIKGVSLTADNKAFLATVASKLKDKPTCNIVVTAYPKADKRQQALADKKLELVKNYLVEKLGISADRITTDKVIDGGDANTIDIKSN